MSLQTPADEPYDFESDYPAPGTAQSIHEDQDFHRAVEAYRFFYPTVSAEGIVNGTRELGIDDGKALVVLLTARPHHLGFTLNSDTPYLFGTLDLSTMGPVVVELPSGPYMGMVNDHHQRWVQDLGIAGPDEGRGGKHLILPPDYEGEVPEGHYIARCQTYKALLAVRAVPDGDNSAGALAALRRIKVLPLSNPSGALPCVDVTHRSFDLTPLRWEDNLDYWKRLHGVIDVEPVFEEFRPMYGELAALGIEKGKVFSPAEPLEAILQLAARTALDEMRVEGFASQRPDRFVWPDRRWEWVGLVTDDPNFETRDFPDLEARDRWFIQAIGVSPAMFRRAVGGGSVYFLAARDESGAYLDGGRTYQLSIPQPVPAKSFWSVTAYDAKTRSQVRAPQNKAVLSSIGNGLEDRGRGGSIDLYFGPSAPGGTDIPWIQTVPEKGVFLYFRIYGPEEAVFDGSWMPGDLTRITPM
jgi:hypothetical protein